jgi:hypothetical protein
MSRAAVSPDDVLAEAARLGVSIRPGGAPGKLKLTGPAEAVKQLLPLVERHKAELLGALAEQRLIASGYVPATGQELSRMAARTEAFERMGLSAPEADALADLLHLRDREGPQDMHACAECGWLRADREGWRCASLRQSLPRDLVIRLQRCPSFLGVDPCN